METKNNIKTINKSPVGIHGYTKTTLKHPSPPQNASKNET